MTKYRLINLENSSKAGIFRYRSAFEASAMHGCYLSSIGGRVVSNDFAPTSCDVRKMCLEAIGEGSILTFGNPSKRTRKEYGIKAFKDGHLWSLRTFTLTFLYVDVPEIFRNDMAFCRRFHLSWQEKTQDGIPLIFTAQGTLRDWKKFLEHSSDKSFSGETRQWMGKTKEIILEFIPELFN